MKKTILSFAVAAFLAVGLASCGSKSDNAASGEATAEGEQPTEQASATEITEGLGTIENKTFSVDVPEGWKVMLNEDKKIIIGVSDVREKLCIEKNGLSYDSAVENQKSLDGCEDLGEQTYGNNKFATFMWKGKFYAYYNSDGNKGHIVIDGSNIQPDNEAIQKVLSSIKIK